MAAPPPTVPATEMARRRPFVLDILQNMRNTRITWRPQPPKKKHTLGGPPSPHRTAKGIIPFLGELWSIVLEPSAVLDGSQPIE